MLPIIDTHQHLWDLREFRLPWIKPGAPLARNFLLTDYREATAGLNVVKTIYMEVDVDPTQHVAEADMVIRTCRASDSQMVGGVIGGRPASAEFADYLARFKGVSAIKGVRQVLHGPDTPAGYCLQNDFLKGVRLLGQHGLTFDICIRPAELGDAAKLIDACPETAFILDHCGNANVQEKDRARWRDGLAKVAERKNVVCKVSGIVASAKPGAWTADDLKPIVEHVLDSFGPHRVMFGGDWPVCTLAATFAEWTNALKAIVAARSAENQRQLFHDNALRVYRLT
jgi:predicted TIM-barrel fold metal-dependent hydrolase